MLTIPSGTEVSAVQRIRGCLPTDAFSILSDQIYPKDSTGNWLHISFIHSPASISQLHALSSTDKLQFLLPMVPCKGSRRFPLDNMSWVPAAAPGGRICQVSHSSGPAILAAAAAAEAGADHSDPPPCRMLAKAFIFMPHLTEFARNFAPVLQVFFCDIEKLLPKQGDKYTVTVKYCFWFHAKMCSNKEVLMQSC